MVINVKQKIIFGDSFSEIALGTAHFGAEVDTNTSFSIMDAYFDAGGSVLDTARLYARGNSEKTVGKWVHERGNRDKVKIVTKGAHPLLTDWLPRVNEREITKDIDESLLALGTDYIDVYYLHRDDESKEVGEIVSILNKLVREGKVRQLGASNWRTERIHQANEFALKNGMQPFTFSQIMWSAAEVNPDGIEDKTLVAMSADEYSGYGKTNVAIMAYSSQAKGLFSHIASHGMSGISERMKKQYANFETEARARRFINLSKESGISPTAISLRCLMSDKLSPIPIIGCSSVSRLMDSLGALRLPDEYIQMLPKLYD